MNNSSLVLIRGAGDLASGVAHRLHRSGFPIIMTETLQPACIRRTVSFAEAVFSGRHEVEGVVGRLAQNLEEARTCLEEGEIAVLVDPEAKIIPALKPPILIDAIMAKMNRGTTLRDAPVVIGLGPGFTAGVDVHAVVETMRGHWLGRVILEGSALPNTGIPGIIDGYGAERVLRAPKQGIFRGLKVIGDHVLVGEEVALAGDVPVTAKIPGVLRGLLHDDLEVYPGMKVGDIDSRGETAYCVTISDKARAIAGGVLEAILYSYRK